MDFDLFNKTMILKHMIELINRIFDISYAFSFINIMHLEEIGHKFINFDLL